MNLTNQPSVISDYIPERLPPNLPDENCEVGISTVPLGNEKNKNDWQTDIPSRYLDMSALELSERIRDAKANLGNQLTILGHHYQRDDVIQFSDFRGDSFGLAQQAAERTDTKFFLFCGVHFMAESADILTSPDQVVMLPNLAAGCSMADMAIPIDVYGSWTELENTSGIESTIPITYMNSAASLKAFVGKHGGAVCTSSNAEATLRWAFQRGERVLFFPDQHLGRNSAKKIGIDPKTEMAVWNPRKPLGGLDPIQISKSKILLWQGHCSVHIRFNVEQIERARIEFPECKIVVHPECTEQVVEASDANGSTEFIVKYLRNAPPGVYGVGTEINLVHRLQRELKSEGKTIFCLDPIVCPCSTMYRIHPAYVCWVLESLINGYIVNQIKVDDETRHWATFALERMLAIS